MLTNNILKAIAISLGIGFITSLAFGHEKLGSAFCASMLLFFVVLYCRTPKKKSKYFSLFLILFTLAHLIDFVSWFFPDMSKLALDFTYYGVNIIYIVSYFVLITRILSALNIRMLLKRFMFSIIVLLILDVFCVVIVTETTKDLLTLQEYTLEFIYNLVVMLLLSIALINYMYRNDNKSMLLLLASICIVFYEIIQLAYFYVLFSNDLGLIYSTFLAIAFVLLYFQSQLKFVGPHEPFSEKTIES